jgi:hypothetical protein
MSIKSVILMDQNYLDTDVIVGAAATSESADFPASNLYDKYRRGKVWRSAGYWEVASGANTIVFRESIGVNLTATIAVANYTTVASFLAAIKTALDAAGASTYTVTQDTTTKKIKITSDGLGGGGIFQIYFSTSSAIAFGAAIGFDTASSRTGALTYTADLLKIHSYEALTWDIGTASNPKALIMAGLRNSALKLTSSAVVYLLGNSTNTWTSPAYSQAVTYAQLQMMLFGENGLHIVGLRYWRLKIIDPSNTYGYIELSKVFLGDGYWPTTGTAQFPLEGDPIDRTRTQFAESGQSYSDVRDQAEQFSFDWKFLTYTEREYMMTIFGKYGLGRPFFVILDPLAVFSSDAGYFARWVKFDQPPGYRLSSPGVYEMKMVLREEI